ncbi:DUF4873 domain-containing protein [Blastococcus sp. SYSU D00820]
MADPHGHDADGYTGEVTVEGPGLDPHSAEAVLAARFDPLAGSVVWTGRIRADLSPSTEVTVTTPHGSARARVTERDVWGAARVTGLERPPFRVELLDGRPPAR